MYKLKHYLLLTKQHPELCEFYSITQPVICRGNYVMIFQSKAKPGSNGFFYREIEFTEKVKPLILDFVNFVKRFAKVEINPEPQFYKQ